LLCLALALLLERLLLLDLLPRMQSGPAGLIFSRLPNRLGPCLQGYNQRPDQPLLI